MLTIIAISPNGVELALRLKQHFTDAQVFALKKYVVDGSLPIKPDLSGFVQSQFKTGNTLVFIMATGIVVRTIAPLLRDKTTDPAVVVVDETGRFAISLLSGHLGGANEAAHQIAELLGAQPVITTASDLHDLEAVDMFAKRHNLLIDNMEDAKIITSLLINKGQIAQLNETACSVPITYLADAETADALVVITHHPKQASVPRVNLLPRNMVLGVGCRRGISGTDIIAFINSTLHENRIDSRCICALASVDIKADEAGIIEAAAHFGLIPQYISRNEIAAVEHLFDGSEFVKKQIGVSAVCEPTAFLAGGQNGHFLIRKQAQDGITLSIFEKY